MTKDWRRKVIRKNVLLYICSIKPASIPQRNIAATTAASLFGNKLVDMLYLHFCIYFDYKDTNKIGNKEKLSQKKSSCNKKSPKIFGTYR